jgi:ABC transporter substrate binding protein (PQQ-dependent alcohol dehydrogenase system)
MWRLSRIFSFRRLDWARRCYTHGLLPPQERVFARRGEGWGGGRFLAQAAPHPRPLPTARAQTSVRSLRKLDRGRSREEGSHPRHRLGVASCVVLVANLASAAFAQTPPAPAQPRVTIGYIDIAGDPRHEPIKAYERIVLKQRESPFAAAQVGIEEAQALSRVLKIDFALERITVKSAEEVAPAVTKALQERGIHFFVVDAPADAFRPLAAAVRGRDVLLFNATAPDDWLRRDLCAREVVHTLPSLAMTMDGLTQYLVSRKWRDILVLQGPLPADAATVKAFENSVKKFGARIIANRPFKVGTDPREREQNNPLLLTAGTRDYDVIFIADDAFEFARQVPFQTVRPRPVVGAIDLEPVAWHWTWERNGGPQINVRFNRASGGRRMDSTDWAAWIAVKMVVQGTLRTRSAEFSKQREFILSDTGFDGYKGLAVSVRRWDQQLRQAVFLATPSAVIASAPIEGFLHRTNTLDSLGDDEPETPCKLNR